MSGKIGAQDVGFGAVYDKEGFSFESVGLRTVVWNVVDTVEGTKFTADDRFFRGGANSSLKDLGLDPYGCN